MWSKAKKRNNAENTSSGVHYKAIKQQSENKQSTDKATIYWENSDVATDF